MLAFSIVPQHLGILRLLYVFLLFAHVDIPPLFVACMLLGSRGSAQKYPISFREDNLARRISECLSILYIPFYFILVIHLDYPRLGSAPLLWRLQVHRRLDLGKNGGKIFGHESRALRDDSRPAVETGLIRCGSKSRRAPREIVMDMTNMSVRFRFEAEGGELQWVIYARSRSMQENETEAVILFAYLCSYRFYSRDVISSVMKRAHLGSCLNQFE